MGFLDLPYLECGHHSRESSPLSKRMEFKNTKLFEDACS